MGLHSRYAVRVEEGEAVSGLPPSYPADDLLRVFGDVALERLNQMRKWGVQRHPSIDPHTQRTAAHFKAAKVPDTHIGYTAAMHHEMPTAGRARSICEAADRDGRLSWTHILLEEFAEAVEAVALYGDESDEARAEVVQTAAVAVAWLESLDARRRGE